jgi:hypothetical protein
MNAERFPEQCYLATNSLSNVTKFRQVLHLRSLEPMPPVHILGFSVSMVGTGSGEIEVSDAIHERIVIPPLVRECYQKEWKSRLNQ